MNYQSLVRMRILEFEGPVHDFLWIDDVRIVVVPQTDELERVHDV
jgi:hypothetical protein